MLDDVLVCSPHDLRYGHTRTALDRDHHILLKKIIALNPDECLALVALADEWSKSSTRRSRRHTKGRRSRSEGPDAAQDTEAARVQKMLLCK